MNPISVIHIIAKLELGGAQQVVLETIKHLNKTRFQNHLITGTKGILVAEAKKIPNLKIYFLPELVREINPVKDLIALMKIYSLLNNSTFRYSPTIVHSHGSKAGALGRIAAKLAGIPVIIHTIHGFAFHDFQTKIVKNLYVFIERLCAKITTKFIAVSFATKKKGLKERIGTKEQYSIINPTIPLKNFLDVKINPQKKKAQLHLNPELPVVGTVSCLKPQKAPLDFIKVAAKVNKKHPETQFVIVGDGILRNKVAQLIEKFELQEKVSLLGWRQDVPEIMAIFDIFVLTSLWEGLPIVHAEAMYAQKPIVATFVDGTPEIVVDGVNGFLAAPHDINTLADKILLLLKNKTLAAKMGNKGKKMACLKFNIGIMIRKIETLYENCSC